jgi:GNAT superfamily N-acetyltransferase
MPARVLPYLDSPDPVAARAAVVEIFFESSVRRNFDDEAAKARFLATWTGWYLTEGAADVWIALDGDGTVAGYLTGCRDSAGTSALTETIPRYRSFADLFDRFPAHLHVNVRAGRRGQGIGTALIERFAEACGTGLHVVTAPSASNVGFYLRNGFLAAVEREGLLFLGRMAADQSSGS